MPWYARKIYDTHCTIIHFEAPRRELADLHNPRSAFVAGLAVGLDRPVLMLAESEYLPPLDYQHLLKTYDSARECEVLLNDWLLDLNLQPVAGTRTQKVKLATELRSLRFGEHVAENERDTLSEYFIDTAAFNDVMAVRNALFLGRKGAGKTANMLQAAARLSEDARNLVIVIKPAAYEFTGLVALLSSLPLSLQQYSIISLWRFLLHSEIANRAVATFHGRPVGVPLTRDERALMDFVDSAEFGVLDDFAVRLERTVRTLSGLDVAAKGSEAEGRDALNEALHTHAIARLRSLLGPVLKNRQRVAVLIDNLDKGWEKSADLEVLSRLLLGLLAAVGKVGVDFQKEDFWRQRISLTLAVFLRTDIFRHVHSHAREPDKIPTSYVEWRDYNLLRRVIEERFLAVRPEGTEAEELWSTFFAPSVRQLPTPDYLLARCLPRPRDVVYLCNASINAAINARHVRVEEEDVVRGEFTYSQFAFEALLVENGITITDFEAVLFEFAGEAAIMTHDTALRLIRAVVSDPDMSVKVLERLKMLSFFGVETAVDRFEYPEDTAWAQRAAVLARKLCESSGSDPGFVFTPLFVPI